MKHFWWKDGGPLFKDGKPLFDETCCCEESCPYCDQTPATITIIFSTDPSLPPAPGPGWLGAWEMRWVGGCCYELTEGLPCGCTLLRGCITSGGKVPGPAQCGATGAFVLHVEAYFPEPCAVEGFTATWCIDPASGDCVANANQPLGPDTVGIGPSGGCDCNFVGLYLDSSILTIEAT